MKQNTIAQGMTFAEWLPLMRKRLGMSQEELADKLGLGSQTISSWEARDVLPLFNFWDMQRFCKIFDTTIEELANLKTLGEEPGAELNGNKKG